MDKLLLISFGSYVYDYVMEQFVSSFSSSSQISGSNRKSKRGLGCLFIQPTFSIVKNYLAGADCLGLKYDHNS